MSFSYELFSIIYLQRFSNDLFVLEAIPLIKKKLCSSDRPTVQHRGKKQLVGLYDDHHDRMTYFGRRNLLTV